MELAADLADRPRGDKLGPVTLPTTGHRDQEAALAFTPGGSGGSGSTLARAKALHRAGQREEALAAYRAAVREKPSDPTRHYLLGMCLLELGQLADGRQAMKRVISLAPRHGPAHFALGKAAMHESDAPTAERHLKTALRCEPELMVGYVELGNLYVAMGRTEEARAVLRQGLERRQDHAGLQANYGNVLYQLGDRRAAIDAWRAALKLDPNMATAHASLGLALRALGHREEAIAALERAVELQPNVPEHRFNLALSYMHRRRYREASEALLAAEPMMRDTRRARVHRARACQSMCDWDGLDALMPELLAEVEEARAGHTCYLTPFATLSLPLDQAARSIVARNHAAETEALALKFRPSGPFAHERKPQKQAGERLRIGYISSDYCDHAIGHLVAGIFGAHDRDRFELFGYSIGPDDGSPWRKRAESGFDRFIDLQPVGDASAAERINADGVDVLIDLNGFTALSRPAILAMRPAPVQATWTGTAGTTGAKFFDYVLTDRLMTPPAMQPFYEEHFCYLPGCYYPYDGETEIAPATVTRADEGLPESAIVLACFCAHYKIDRASFASWCETLRAVPEAVLWLLGESPEGEANLRAAAEAAGVNPARLIFAARKPRADHMARLSLADLALETFIYGAHTTAADVLRAGVPMLTRLGPDFPSRVAASVLTSVGLPELIAPDIEGCTQLATQLAADRAQLAALRTKVKGLIGSAPIFDTKRLVRGVEKACDAMWARYAAGEVPAIIDLSEPPYAK